MAMQDVRKQEAEEKADVTERTVSVDVQRIYEAIGLNEGESGAAQKYCDLARADLARLSAWMSGDVARARELAREVLEDRHWHESQGRRALREIVALLTPKDAE